ncbi:hypothetical protein RDI58_026869 [Solanum bulbocastanum]|uniref:GAG-pre-integrase domain-containing protein n=1 Tax=Solanum bulbocastanum TaxID=147425 RepID=A0AAN8T155_SOLBU
MKHCDEDEDATMDVWSHKRGNSNDGAGYSRSNEGVQGDGSNSFGNTQNQPTGYRPQGRFQHNSGGYRPPWPAARGGSSGFRPRANSTYTSAEPSSQGHFFSDRQYDQMLHMTGNEEPSQYSANLAGDMSQINNEGKTMIMGDQVIHNVLHVPEFKFNLLSVSKLTRELSCVVTFFPDFCIFQALSNGKVMGIGKEREGLYILKESITSPTSDTSTNLSTKISSSVEDTLWHYRLGHPSCAAMQHISSLPRKVHSHVHDTCNMSII